MKFFLILLLLIALIIIFIVCYINYLKYSLNKKYISYSEIHTKLLKVTNDLPKNNRINIPVYYINLDISIDRNYTMVKQLRKYNINGFRIRALYGKLSNSVYEGEIDGVKFTNDYSLSYGELGCTLSHLSAIKKSYDNGDDMALILEDDCSIELMPLWEKDLLEEISNFDYDLIQVSNSSCEINENISNYIFDCYGTFSYVIKRSGMKNILDKFYKNGKYKLQKFNNDSNKYDGRADILLYKYAGKSKMLFKPLFFTMGVHTTTIHLHLTSMNDLMAINKSVKSILYYIDKYDNFIELSPRMYVPINNKPVIWQLWPGEDDIPPYLQMCHETVKKYNSDFFSVILIRPSNLDNYIKWLHPAYKYLSYVHRADYLRCFLLHEYGGIYIDIDTICFESLENYFKKITNSDVVGYDGKEWGEIWGMSLIGPCRPNSIYTTNWKNKLMEKLDENLYKLEKYRLDNDNLKNDNIEWSYLLRDIVLPLSIELKNKIFYEIHSKNWQSINDKDILMDIPMQEITSEILILNNALYPDSIKKSTNEEIKKNEKNILLFNLINYALEKNIMKTPDILPGVQKIIYINLKHRYDRKNNVINEFKQIGIHSEQLHRIEAFYTPENGAVGCLTSHIEAIRVAIKDNSINNVLICEDDIHFVDDRETLFRKLTNFFDDPIFKVNFNVLFIACNLNNMIKTHNKTINRIIDGQTASAYIVNRNYLSKLLDLYEITLNTYYKSNKKWISEFCNDQCWKVLQKTDNWYGFNNFSAIQVKSYSDIEKKIVNYGV